MKKGIFITFEGADGCGKTTQLELLKKYLDEKGIKNIQTREPGATDLGKDLRKILLHYDKPVSNVAETYLYLADRAQHVEFEIKPALEKGIVVLCDRECDFFNFYKPTQTLKEKSPNLDYLVRLKYNRPEIDKKIY